MTLKFEFHWLKPEEVDHVYDKIEQKTNRDLVIEGETPEAKEKRIEEAWYRTRPSILNQVLREAGIDLGETFHKMDQDPDFEALERRLDEEDEAMRRDEWEEDEEVINPEVEKETEFISQIRQEIDELLSLHNNGANDGLFIALAKDEGGKVIGMMSGLKETKKPKEAAMYSYIIGDEPGLQLHQFVEEQLRKKRFKVMRVLAVLVEKNEATLKRLSERRYKQINPEEYKLNIKKPWKKRKLAPRRYYVPKPPNPPFD